MSSKPTQVNRIAELVTRLGTDKLVLSSFEITEELSKPFEIRVECLSEDQNIDFNPALGQKAHIRYNTIGRAKRYFSGILVEASWFGERDAMASYQLVLRPWFWLLTQASDCRIFQNKTPVQIIEDVFKKSGFTDFEIKTTETYKEIDYYVQYRETNFDFVCRTMETFGIYYYFRHSADNHIMVLADAKNSHQPIPSLPKCRFIGMGDRTRDTEETLSSWLSGRMFRTGKVTVKAFDFDKPKANLTADHTSGGGYAHDTLEVYDYPEKYKQGEESDLGQKYAKARLQAAQSLDKRRHAAGDAASLFPGGLVTLEKHPMASENKEYLVVAATHSFVAESYRSGQSSASGDSYSGHYTLQLSDRPFRAPIETPKPVICGPQTAVVVGPKGEEIYTDKHGRIKVQFHWDRLGKNDDKSSRWIRVSQTHSGKGWGGVYLPRIGMEVVVEFIEGDPDRPLVVGTVYNGDNKMPYEMPANKTQAGMKTRSSKGGGESNYNELVFEDKKGSEFVRFHAEKDVDSTIEDAEKHVVKGKNKSAAGETTREVLIEKGDEIITIKTGDQKVKIGRHQVIDVDDTISITAKNKITITVGLSSITMDKSSIKIESPEIMITSTKSTTIDAGVALIEKAGVIKLN
jgi:type VI secretion system secreted protein VgrG